MINEYKFISTEIEGVYIIKPFYISDERGFIKKSFEKNIFKNNGIEFEPIEEMETTSKKNVIRGLHFQIKEPQAKLVRCVRGKMLDVIVDIRKDSKTFGKKLSVILSQENKKMLYIPRGFAHGCRILEDNTTFYYLSDNRYYPEFDSGIKWNDEELNIDWQLDKYDNIIISEKDRNLQTFKEYKKSL